MLQDIRALDSIDQSESFRTSLRGFCLGGLAMLCAAVAAPALAAQPDATAIATEVDGLITAGEFGAAVELARQADPATRDQLLQKVIAAQLASGETMGARAVVRQIPRGPAQNEAVEEISRQQLVNGGADFGPLMNLIQTTTGGIDQGGPWFDIDGEGGTMAPFQSGIKVDPNGVLARELREDRSGRLSAVGQQARTAALNEDMARASSLRLVSLTRLEKEVARRLAEGKPVVESMKNLAGLSQIRYLLVFPEQGEIVIGGPAAGWKYNGRGQPISLESGKPTLQLEDLVTVMRTFSPAGQAVFGCSIDPRQENLKAVMDYVAASQAKGPLSSGGVRSWANKIGKLLGEQDITVFGVPASSRVSRVMVEADYRMKLIGIGKLEGGPHVPDYFELLAKNPSLASGSLDALRWWMTMKYDSVLHSPDHNAFEISGSAVKCLSENQFLTQEGERVATGKSEPVNQQFAANFTQHYQDLAAKDPVFADLQGIFDLALVAAIIQRNQLDARANWDRGVFAVGGDYQPAMYAVPQKTETVTNYRVFNGKDVVLQVAGGVRADLAAVLNDPSLQKESPRLTSISQSAEAPELPPGRWWWDAK